MNELYSSINSIINVQSIFEIINCICFRLKRIIIFTPMIVVTIKEIVTLISS